MRNSRSFQGLFPLDPTRALPWTHWGLTAPPGPQLELAMTVGHCISCLRHDSPTPPPPSNFTLAHLILLYPTQKLDNPPNRRTSHQKTAKKSSTGGMLLRGVTLHVQYQGWEAEWTCKYIQICFWHFISFSMKSFPKNIKNQSHGGCS